MISPRPQWLVVSNAVTPKRAYEFRDAPTQLEPFIGDELFCRDHTFNWVLCATVMAHGLWLWNEHWTGERF